MISNSCMNALDPSSKDSQDIYSLLRFLSNLAFFPFVFSLTLVGAMIIS